MALVAKEIDLSTAFEDMKVIEDMLNKYTRKYSRSSLCDQELLSILTEYDYNSEGFGLWLSKPLEEVYLTILCSDDCYFDLDMGHEFIEDYIRDYLIDHNLATDKDPEEDN